jgi:hypothetical protein
VPGYAAGSSTFTAIDIANTFSPDWKHVGGVLGPNGLIYFVPGNADNIGVLNPSTSSFITIDIANTISSDWQYPSTVSLNENISPPPSPTSSTSCCSPRMIPPSADRDHVVARHRHDPRACPGHRAVAAKEKEEVVVVVEEKVVVEEEEEGSDGHLRPWQPFLLPPPSILSCCPRPASSPAPALHFLQFSNFLHFHVPPPGKAAPAP